ncbi:hypothetical protein L6164_003264 [Bauhinia variegata]|uniref:Uncharacterized protein n=1 Tax=Bauhinia variegata TaxID=167791 RepID=A0ACB9Q2A2_BAUVA|nr:hypothetical protein L6164_003264 [Bauhinia variegata]
MQMKKKHRVGGEGKGWVTQKKEQNDQEEERNPDGNGGNGHWQDLPAELLELILQRLSIIDYLQCGAVCLSWRIKVANAIASKLCPPAPQFPFVLLFPRQYSDKDYHLLSPSENRLSTVRSKWPSAVVCVGSVEGWLIMNFLDYCTQDQTLHSFTYFLNPVSGTRMMLPATSISSFSKTYAKSGITISCKAVASSIPDCPNCHVATQFSCVVTRKQQLAFCRVTEKLWKVINHPLKAVVFSDIAFYDNKLYAVGTTSSDVVNLVMAFDLRDPNALVKVLLDPSPVSRIHVSLIKCELDQRIDTKRIFLAKDSIRDELLLVFHIVEYFLNLDAKLSTDYLLPIQTKGFCVFKLDKSCFQWVEVDNLGNLSLFLDKQSSRVISITDLDGSMESIRGNCIYFALDLGCSVDPSLARDIGVFSLTDRSIKQISLNPSFQIRAPTLWFTPSIW